MKITYTWRHFKKNLESHIYLPLHHLHIWCPNRAEECIRSPGSGNTSSSESSDIVLGIILGYIRGTVLLSKLSRCQICHYNTKNENAPLLFLSPITLRWWKSPLDGCQRIQWLSILLWIDSPHCFIFCLLTQFYLCEQRQQKVWLKSFRVQSDYSRISSIIWDLLFDFFGDIFIYAWMSTLSQLLELQAFNSKSSWDLFLK